jgi:hypothetical protein
MNEAVFTSFADARRAADAAMPRRRRNRPYPLASGWHWGRAVPCPECSAAEGADCAGRYHRAREDAARAAGRSADRWIVCAPSNLVLLADGTMYDHARKATVRQ